MSTHSCAAEMKYDPLKPQVAKVHIGVRTIFGRLQWHDFGPAKQARRGPGAKGKHRKVKTASYLLQPLPPKSPLGRLMFRGQQAEAGKPWGKNDASITLGGVRLMYFYVQRTREVMNAADLVQGEPGE